MRRDRITAGSLGSGSSMKWGFPDVVVALALPLPVDALGDEVEALDQFGDLTGLQDRAPHAAACVAQVHMWSRSAGVGVAGEPAVDFQNLTVDSGFHARGGVLVLFRFFNPVGSHPRMLVPDGPGVPGHAARRRTRR